ncbi:MAG: hypothetical protein GY953_27295 [bacterium]|nr:hypothetical protein [bacterium]
MRRLLLILLVCPLVAQQSPPVGIVRGDLVKWDPAGWLHVAKRDRKVEVCRFDRETYITDSVSRVEPSTVKVGSRVEAVVDHRDNVAGCRAITIYVPTAAPDGEFAAYRRALARQRHVLDHILPRGDMTFAGVVLEHDPSRMLVKTRSAGRKEVRLRDDTYFTSDGRPTDASMLKVRMKVFVRAGTGIDGALEAYQVVRGEILTPR